MSENFSYLVSTWAGATDEELRRLFGDEAIVSRIGRFCLVHLDRPEAPELQRRVAEFNPEDLFEDDCPLCRMMKDEPLAVVYDRF